MIINSIEQFDISQLTNGSDITFSDIISADDIISIINNINDYEQKMNVNFNIQLKNLSFDKKINIIKFYLVNKNILNDNIIHNIILLIRSHNTLSDNFFNSSNIYFNSLDELLNIKLDLMDELLAFKQYILSIFYSMLKSLNKFKFSPLDFCIKMSKFDEIIFNNLDLLTISSLISNNDDTVNFSTCPYLYDAEIYFSKLALDHVQTVMLVEQFLNGISHGTRNK